MKTVIENLLLRIEEIELSPQDMTEQPEVYVEILEQRGKLIDELLKLDLKALSTEDREPISDRIHKLVEKNNAWTKEMQSQLSSLKEEGKKFLQSRQAARGYLSTQEAIGPGIHKFA